ncbi:MAG: polysaccharide deacetylase family protein [Acidobacteria bacterium]|nr:polysaccharide deacetylase family protein [Acidobacteriota bacterium]
MRGILTYHSIDATGSPISCLLEAFDRHLAWLLSGKVRVTTVEELLTMAPSENAIAITFDDAFTSFGDIAAPRLLARGLPVTVFVVAERVGTTNAWDGRVDPRIPQLPLLDWDALGRLASQGVELGSHTRSHRDLTRVNRRVLQDEVGGSAEVIAAKTGVRPTSFAYPYGSVDTRACEIVAQTYRCGCTTEFQTLQGTINAARLPRLDAYYFQQPGILEAWGTPAFERFVRRRHWLRRVRRVPETVCRRMLREKRAL